MKYNIFKLPNLEKKDKLKLDSYISNEYATPLLSLGYFSQISKTKEELKNLDIEKLRVINEFEHKIDNKFGGSNESIQNTSYKYFEGGPKIISRAFYKLWEIMLIFNFVNNDASIKSLNLAEAPGSFIQAIMYYRDKFANNTSKDIYYTASINGPIKYDDMIKNNKAINIMEGDITDPAFIDSIKINNIDIVTADGGFEWVDENKQEQEALKLIIGEIIIALENLKKGGTFILKLFDMFTLPTLKLIIQLQYCFKDVYIIKPLTSRPTNAEKYLIGIQYIGVDIELVAYLKSLLSKDKIIDLFINNDAPAKTFNAIKNANIKLLNIQYEYINKMKGYIAGEYNDIYYLNKQHESNIHWISQFFPIGKKDHKEVIKEFENILNKI